MKIYDISCDLLEAPLYGDDPKPEVQYLQRLDMGDECNLTALYASLHTGTHADAPSHFLEGGSSIDQMSPDLFIGPCRVIQVEPGPLTGNDIDRVLGSFCKRVIFKGRGKAYLSESAAFALAYEEMKLVGIDAPSISAGNDEIAAHRHLLSSGAAILEGLRLSEVPPGEYFLIAPPIKIKGMEAGFVRALLLEGVL